MAKYNIQFADSHIMSIFADKVEINNKMLSFKLEGELVGYIQLTKHSEVTRYNFKDFEIMSITHFTLEDDKIIETTKGI